MAGCCVFLVILFLLLPHYVVSYYPTSRVCDIPVNNVNTTEPEKTIIPNQVHYVYILSDPEGDFGFDFSHFLSIYATSFYWRPTTIYFHTNAPLNGGAIARARDGQAGKWTQLIFTMFDNLQINIVDAPTHTSTGKEIQGMEHRSDFARVKAVQNLGGIYIDWDVHPLRDIAVLRESGFKAIAGRQLGEQVNSGVFMTVKEGKMITRWMYGMHEAYTGGWTTHSNEVITKFGQRLVREPGEMLIMERDAFAPGGWGDVDTDTLFRVHNDTESNLHAFDPAVDTLPLYEESFDDRWEHADEYPSWAHDYSSSYMLHAFSPSRWGHQVEGFNHISPRYVLERRSNFARAVYPVARQMYEQGLFDIEDSYDGQ